MISAVVVVSRLPVGSSAKSVLGLVTMRAGDRHALLLAAGKLGRRVALFVGRPTEVERLAAPARGARLLEIPR